MSGRNLDRSNTAMQRDPFYRQIIARLNEPLDPESFEQCAADLLREYHPTLVPIRGGSDAGMDGAVADGEGEPFPLVTTTAKDASGNLKRNLTRYKEEGHQQRKAIFATSQALTPRRRRNLFEKARELGFTLMQVYAQDFFANLLYRSPEWCKELLGLSGDPAALSILPKTTRPLLFDQPLIGRDKEYQQLSDGVGDKLLVGQPGCGKTFLLYRLASEGHGLFVISSDRGEIAAAIRAAQPSMLFVDDAKVRSGLIGDLRHIRSTTGADFTILASCWPGDREHVAQELGIAPTSILELPLLIRDEVVKVVKGAGLYGPNELIGYIVDQAEGRPGLAVTLAHLCIQGQVKEVLYGDIIQRDVLRFFESYVGKRAQVVLAALSVGGDTGMEMEAVARILGMGLADVYEVLTQLSAGGVIVERHLPPSQWDLPYSDARRLLAVRPDALRHALVRDVFFGGTTILPFEALLELIRQAPSISHATETLMGAKARGGTVPEALLHPLIEQAGDDLTYRRYASIGRGEALWIMEQHPEKLIAVARPVLSNVAEKAIPLLLTVAVGDERPLHSTPAQPLRLIKDWTHAGEPGIGEALQRRRVLFHGTLRWVKEGGDIDVALQAFGIALSPAYEATSTDPGFGATLTLYRGCLTLDEMDQLMQLWDEFWHVVAGRDGIDWQPILNVLHTWVYPGVMLVSGRQLDVEASEAIRRHAAHIVEAAAAHARSQPGVLRRLERYVTATGADIQISGDRAFNIFYPKEDRGNWQAAQERQAKAAAALARQWHQRDPEAVVAEVAAIDHEAALAGITWPKWTEYFYTEISQYVKDHLIWCRALIHQKAPYTCISPFLHAAAGTEPGWLDVASTCLDQPDLRWPAIELALTRPALSQELLDRAFEHVAGYPAGIGFLCGRGRVAEQVLRRLLEHENAQVAVEAAEGEWRAEPEKSVRESVQDAWRSVVVNHATEEYWLRQFFEADSELARAWLLARMKDDSLRTFYSDWDNNFQIAMQAQSNQTRASLLTMLAEMTMAQPGDRFRRSRWIALLVGDELPLYRLLLAEPRLQEFHLAPLERGTVDTAQDLLDRAWVGFAQLAFEAGYTPQDVFGATQPGFYSWSGPISNVYARWEEDFMKLLSSDSEEIRQVGELGVAWAKARREKALEKEHREAIYGLR